jgi:hypothetical protein
MYKRIKVELLEADKNKNAISFCNEALNIEFTQLIGKMDASCCIGSVVLAQKNGMKYWQKLGKN